MKKKLTKELAKKRFEVINEVLHKLYPEIKPALNYKNAWELLVATILSAQTKDETVNKVTEKLFKLYPKPEDFVKAGVKKIAEVIKGVNYYRNKAKFLVENAKIILKQFNGKVPNSMEDMLKLKGVARKTANIVLANAYNVYEGIAVDTHVKRLSKVLGLTNETKPEKIEKDLMEIVPKNEWGDFPLRLIQYGRDFCPAKKHDHKNCPLTLALKKKKLL
jgi:endonuclease-3